MNFLALAVISEFDDKFYDALGADINKSIVEDAGSYEDLYKITRTTSRNAVESNRNALSDDTIPRNMNNKPVFIKEVLGKRGPVRILLRLIYKTLRVVQISLWFYFLPFIALLGSYLVPYYLETQATATADL